MARPTGRYFASVIAKIRDAKNNEKIIVDADFKQLLRGRLVMKIAGAAQPAKIDWRVRLAPFKVFFAAVPALALVIVAVAGLSKVPFATNPPVVKNEVVVPIANTVTNETVVTAGVGVPEIVVPSDSVVPGIKTFPGYTVLPASYFQANVVAPFAVQEDVQSVAPVVAPQNSRATSKTSGQSDSASNSPIVQPTTSFVPNPTNQNSVNAPLFWLQAPQQIQNQPQFNAQFVPNNFQTQPAQIILPTPVAVPNTIVAPNPVAATPAIQPPQPVVISTPIIQPVVTSAPIVNSVPVVTSQPVAIPAVRTRPKTIEAPAPAVLPTLNEMAQLPAQDLAPAVMYNGNFSTDERTLLEKNILPNLVQGRNVSYIRVYENDASTMVVELNYNDGRMDNYSYKLADSVTTLANPALVQNNLQTTFLRAR